MKHLVYMARCRATNRVYIGCTRKTLRERQGEHHFAAVNGSPYKFHRALRELGLSSFQWSVLGEYDSPAAMFGAERSFIAKYNSYRFGYNSTEGGQGSPSDGAASRRKMPARRPYPNSPRKLLLRR